MSHSLIDRDAEQHSHMKSTTARSLKPRKTPAQRRSAVTVDVIFEATIQVLLAHGFDQTTTTRIAERAGVSVGSVYQYFPNKRALLAAVVRRHIAEVVAAGVAACESVHGATLREMCSAAVSAFVDAKTRRPEVSRALYLPAAAVGADLIVREESVRSVRAVHAMLVTAADAQFKQPQIVSQVMVTSVIGPMQAAIEAGGGAPGFAILKQHLTSLCVGYAKEMSTPIAKRACTQSP
jgi:AcrR family transcriptional regulator